MKNSVPYPTADALLGEKLHPNEEATAAQISDHVEAGIRAQYQSGLALRDVHAKATGCLKAEFRDTWPRVSLFREPSTRHTFAFPTDLEIRSNSRMDMTTVGDLRSNCSGFQVRRSWRPTATRRLRIS